MLLYSLPLSPYSARVRAAIYSKGLTVDIQLPPPDWRTSPEFREISPFARIPVLLLDDDTPIVESGVIVEYLDEAYPDTPLLPEGPKARAQVRFVTQAIDAYVMTPMMSLFFLLDARAHDEAALQTGFLKLEDGLTRLDALMAHGHRFACGERVTIADVWLTPVRFSLDGLMDFAQRTDLLDGHPHVRRYVAAVQSDGALGRVWQEMVDGLAAFYAGRAAT
jgi:glutathione S-transferase